MSVGTSQRTTAFSERRKALATAEKKNGTLRYRCFLAIKRVFDIVGSLVGLAVLFLPMVIIAVLIRLDSPGNPLFMQERLGLNGKPFFMFKFRSMTVDAEKDGPQWAVESDPRCTPFGAFLRRSKIDEFPQLLNILVGNMSFIGPRPERPYFYDLFETYIPNFRDRLAVKPGLSGLAQVNGGYDLGPEEKLAYDLEYIEHQSFLLDLDCIVKTFYVIFTGNGMR